MKVGLHSEVWFIDGYGRWFYCRVTSSSRHRVTIDAVTGYDQTRTVEWPYEDGLEISRASHLFARLRPYP